MNLAIEYIFRNERARGLLQIPCSLLLTHRESNNKLIVSLHNHYGMSDRVLVRHWKMWEDNKTNKLPPFDEHVINKQDIFTSEFVVMKDYSIIEYVEEPYETGYKQHSEPPHSLSQERDYSSCIEFFYNNKSNLNNRTNWLWERFEEIHVPNSLKFHYAYDSRHGKELQRDIVNFYDKTIWNAWLHWRKHLLDMSTNIATELIFKHVYHRPKDNFEIEMAKKYVNLFNYALWNAYSD